MKSASPLDDLRWVLEFSAVDLEPISATDLNRWRDRALKFTDRRSPPSASHVFTLTRAAVAWMPSFAMARGVAAEDVRAVLTALQLKIRAALEKMEAGLPWSPPVVTSTLKLTDGKMRRSLEAKDGTPETIFLAAAADLFVAHWDESVRKCEAPACGRLFVPKDRREKYHSLGCGKEYRWEKFARKRVRDYAAEYERRQKKLLGRRVKIKHRRPRP